jgi:predicted permease
MAFVFAFKFVLWPVLALVLIVTDNLLTHLFSEQVHKILMLLAIMPLPANAVAFSLQLDVQPDKASTQVFLSTVFALIYIPIIMTLWG